MCPPFPLYQVCDRPQRFSVGVAFNVIATIRAPTIIIAIILAAVMDIAIILAAFRVIAVSFPICFDTVCVAVIAALVASILFVLVVTVLFDNILIAPNFIARNAS